MLFELRSYVGIADPAVKGARCAEKPCSALRIGPSSCDSRQSAEALGGEVHQDVVPTQPQLPFERVPRPVQIVGEECLQTHVAVREGREERVSEFIGERTASARNGPAASGWRPLMAL